MQGQTAQPKRLSPTIWYLLTALLWSWPAFWIAGSQLRFWEQGDTFQPLSVAVIHAFILGFLLTVVFGVLYQVVPIAFQAPTLPRHLLYWHLPLHTVAVLMMVAGFLTGDQPVLAAGGTLLFAGTVAYGTYALRSYRAARNQTQVHRQLLFPLVTLLLVIFLGLWMAYGAPESADQPLVTHVMLGGLGFWVGLVITISYKFIPMFALSHGYQVSLPTTSRVYYSGLLILVLSGLAPAPLAAVMTVFGSLAGIVACGMFMRDMLRILQARKRKRIVLPLRFALAATLCVVVAAIALFGCLLSQSTVLLIPAAYLLLFGGLIPLIFSYMQKIVPFLWFEYRFARHKDRSTAPPLDDMLPKKRTFVAMTLYYTGAILGMVTLCFGSHFSGSLANLAGLFSGGAELLASVLLFSSLLQVYSIGGWRPADGQ